MYKGKSANLQRKHRVVEIRKPSECYIAEDDLVQSAENMGMQECVSERAMLILQKTRAENELTAAKAEKDAEGIRILGARIQGYCSRLGLITRRISVLKRDDNEQAFSRAVKELVSRDVFAQIVARQQEILASIQHTGE